MTRSGRRLVRLALAGAVLGAWTVSASAQDPEAVGGPNGPLRVFLECSGGSACDQREFRTQIDWVDWMRQRQDAQLHVIVTGQGTASGGRSYVVDFIGQDGLEDVDDRLTFSTLGSDVRDEAVRGLGRVLGVGIARYALLAGSPTPVEVVRAESVDESLLDRLVTSDQVNDPWDFWVFEIDVGTDLSGETTRSNRRFSGGFEASRTTTTWKFEFEADGSWRRSEIELSDTTIVDTRRDWDVQLDLVYALADHWSFGGGAEVSAATRTNQDLRVDLGPELEYSVWPYEEAPRRSLRARYQIGLRHLDYEEATLFGFTKETRPVEQLRLSLSQRQPWGSVFADLTGSHYLHDPGKYRVSTGGFLSFRVVRGLDLNVNGRAAWIRDQLFLPAAGVSDEEILLERRRVASNFDWDLGIGFSFQFGSIYNNVVNNRF